MQLLVFSYQSWAKRRQTFVPNGTQLASLEFATAHGLKCRQRLHFRLSCDKTPITFQRRCSLFTFVFCWKFAVLCLKACRRHAHLERKKREHILRIYIVTMKLMEMIIPIHHHYQNHIVHQQNLHKQTI